MAKIIEKPWGSEEILLQTNEFVVKRILVKAHHRLSLQFHRVKIESWLVLRGRGLYVSAKGEDSYNGKFVDSIPANAIHRLEAYEDTEIIEVSTPELDDVVRVEDDYGRVDKCCGEG